MNPSKGKVKYSYNDQVVDSIEKLPTEDYNQLIGRISEWRKSVSEATIKNFLSTNHPNETIEWEWVDEVKKT